MEKYILNGLFMLAILSIVANDYAFAQNKKGKLTTADCCKNSKKLISETRELSRVEKNELKDRETAIFMVSDTGKHVRKFFFYDMPGWNKKFPDSLLSGFRIDSALKGFRFHLDTIYNGFPRQLYPERPDNSIEMPNMIRRKFPRVYDDRLEFPGRPFNPRKNSQSFTFRNTDKDGITTHIQVEVDDPSAMELEKMSVKASNGELRVEGLSFSPNFSTGKITLMFSLAGKGDIGIKVIDNEFNTVFTDSKSKFSGTYQSTLALFRNGIYYLVITRQDKTFVKRIIKKE